MRAMRRKTKHIVQYVAAKTTTDDYAHSVNAVQVVLSLRTRAIHNFSSDMFPPVMYPLYE